MFLGMLAVEWSAVLGCACKKPSPPHPGARLIIGQKHWKSAMSRRGVLVGPGASLG